MFFGFLEQLKQHVHGPRKRRACHLNKPAVRAALDHRWRFVFTKWHGRAFDEAALDSISNITSTRQTDCPSLISSLSRREAMHGRSTRELQQCYS